MKQQKGTKTENQNMHGTNVAKEKFYFPNSEIINSKSKSFFYT